MIDSKNYAEARICLQKVPEGPAELEMQKFINKREEKIVTILKMYPEPRPALIPILFELQRDYGWIPPMMVKIVAERLRIEPSEAYGVATFYSLMKTKRAGKYVIMICGTLSCELKGSAEVIKAAETALDIKVGETTKDGKITLKRVECLGYCDKAPVVQIDNSSYCEKVTPEEIVKIIKRLKNEF